MEGEPAGHGRGVDALLEHHQVDAALGQEGGDAGEMAYRAGHPGQPGDHELVPGPEVIEAGIPSGAAGQPPGSDIGPDPLAPGIGPAGELGRREEALAAIQEATDLCRELAARWPGAYHQELEQSLRVAAWLDHGEDHSDAAPREPK